MALTEQPESIGVAAGVSIRAVGLGLQTRRGPVFSNIDLTAAEGDIVCLAGPAGTGRTSLSLALCARMKFSSGELSVAGKPLPANQRWLRKISTISPGSGFGDLDDGLRVIEEIRRAYWMAGRHRRSGAAQTVAAAGLIGRERTLIRDLPASDIQRLNIACAFVDDSRLVVISDIGSGVRAADQPELWELVEFFSKATGATTVVTSIESNPARGVADQIVELADDRSLETLPGGESL